MAANKPQQQNRPVPEVPASHCADVPDFRRLNYFFGQLLGVDDFQSEQAYFREKQRLHNRCLHGYGTVCGLLVKPAPPLHECKSEQDPKREKLELEIAVLKTEIAAHPDEAAARADLENLLRELESLPQACPPEKIHPRVEVECGLALDCHGNEIVVRRTETLDLWERLSRDERATLEHGHHDVFVSICFCEKPVSPVRPVHEGSCEPSNDCVFGKLQDSYRFHVSLDRPDPDQRCEGCCTECVDCCLLLARIRDVRAHGNLDEHQVRNRVRRRVGLYDPTRITGVNWTHGAEYWIEEADDLLGGQYCEEEDGGLVFQTSHSVNVHSLRRGVVDVWVVRGGSGPHADVYSLETEIAPIDPRDGFTRRFRVRYLGDELLDNGDRVMVTVRGAFILDRCCQPLDGLNVGGFVPLLPDERFRRFDKYAHGPFCTRDPYGPPRSGVGVPGGSNFESWFYVKRRHGEGAPRVRRPRGEHAYPQGD
jgi:hypothetical protein